MALTINGAYVHPRYGAVMCRNGDQEEYAAKNVTYDTVKVWNATFDALIPTMTSNTAPSGTAKCRTKYSSAADAYKAFDGSTTTQWLSSNNSDMSIHYLQYTFDEDVAVDSIAYMPSKTNAQYQDSYDCTITFSLLDADGNVLETVSHNMLAADILTEFTVQLDNVLHNVRSVKVTFSNRMKNGNIATDAHYVSCGEMQVYGYIES